MFYHDPPDEGYALKLKCKKHGRRVMVFEPFGSTVHRSDGSACLGRYVNIGGVSYRNVDVIDPAYPSNSFAETRSANHNYRQGASA